MPLAANTYKMQKLDDEPVATTPPGQVESFIEPATGPTVKLEPVDPLEGAEAANELLLAAYLMARPDWWPSMGGANLLPRLQSPTARAVLTVIEDEGEAFAKPGPMKSALMQRTLPVDADELLYVFGHIPARDDLAFKDVEAVKEKVVKDANDRKFALKVKKAGAQLEKGRLRPEDAAADLQRAIDERHRDVLRRDHSAGGILGRIRERAEKGEPPRVRWRCGNDEFDLAFKGVGPSGKAGFGMLAQKEVTLLSAGPGTGKTREALNWVNALETQGANVAIFAQEDDELAFSTRLMAAKFDVQRWMVEQYLVLHPADIAWRETENYDKCRQAVEWFSSIEQRLRIYDVEGLNLFDFSTFWDAAISDKATYGTTHLFVDYFQAFRGAFDPEQADDMSFRLRELAARYNLGVVVLSQQSGQDLRYGSSDGMVSTKGTTTLGQMAHIGIEIDRDPEVGDAEFRLNLKKGRDGGRRMAYVTYDVTTGRALEYKGTPDHWPLEGGKKGKKGR